MTREEYPKHWYEYKAYGYHVLVRGFKKHIWIFTLSKYDSDIECNVEISTMRFECRKKQAQKIGVSILEQAIQCGA